MKPIFKYGSRHKEAAAGDIVDPIYTRHALYTAALTATNTLSATAGAIIQQSIPANTLAVGDIIEIEAMGRFNSTAIATADTCAVTLGTSATPTSNPGVCTSSYKNAATARTNLPVQVSARLVVRAIGASGSVMGQIRQWRHVLPTTIPVATTLALTFNTTVANTLAITYASGNAAASVSWETASIKIIR